MPLPSSRLALAALALACGAAAHAQISDDVVRIGVMADQTGPYSGNGGPGSTLAVRMAAEDFGGAVLGKPVEVVVADDQNKPDVGLNIARKWLDTEKVDTIVGGSASSIALGISSLLKERKKPYLIAGTVSAELTNKSCSPMNFQFLTDTYALPKAGVQSLMKQGIKSFYFITVDYAFGQAYQDDATRFIQAAGGKVVGSVKHPLGATDFSSYLLQAQSSGAQAIVILNAGLDLSNALKQAAEYKITRGGQVVTVFGMTINSVSAMGLDVAQGLQLTLPFYWDRDEASRAWAKRFMARNKGVVPTYIHAGAYSAAWHYLQAVKAAGTDDGAKVAAKMRELPINDFFSKDVKIREDGQALRTVYAIQVKKPSESKGPNDFYTVRGEIPPEQTWRPLSESSCDYIKAAAK
ncbi:ABC transporter substrate-binding protein [Acidovorax sp. SUPP950]|uniref:ABC transporter substrate-binding protein n=1 Tax=unclassified Acidovorax TaxID=2684926 RepID=UPI00234B7B35|nr:MULTISPECIES: ABC transporter substrate-binding protein [Comamonadaceae]WCM97686.1 ABC transporter substrate-binding protein [Acidovorax sp. GBBC 1281]WOI46397.1 ABC transporter substrate-binding protein [Paracidovorax avenae]GKS76132.1 ABC transporter substrate-binding protein [Acidovorax sp. SUPP950]GKS89744.1 ABC transporter substrate-binding protein [Acidovorax sp. SUPP2539]GKT13289.1 ABC transporter substrate-binding protein [Acidovorax sp. SUPP2522]